MSASPRWPALTDAADEGAFLAAATSERRLPPVAQANRSRTRSRWRASKSLVAGGQHQLQMILGGRALLVRAGAALSVGTARAAQQFAHQRVAARSAPRSP